MQSDTSLSQRIKGTWRLLSAVHEAQDGTRVDQLGPGATGFLIYTDDGYVSAHMQAMNRGRFGGDDPFEGSLAEFKAAASGYIAYCGRYTLDENTSVLTHEMAVSLFPNWVGGRQQRIATFQDGNLVLRTGTPMPSRDGQAAVITLTWERAR